MGVPPALPGRQQKFDVSGGRLPRSIDETLNRELPSTRKGISSTDDHESLSRNGSKVQLYKMVRAAKRRSQKLTRIVSAHTGEAFLRVEGSRAEATGTSRFERLQN